MAKAGNDCKERWDSEEMADSVGDEKRWDGEEDVVNDTKGLGMQRWSWLVEESKICAAKTSSA